MSAEQVEFDPSYLQQEENWQAYSACAVDNWPAGSPHDPEAFFPKRLEGGQCAPAKSICQMCPVRTQCLVEGLREPTGVWGGLSEKERRTAQKMVKNGASPREVIRYFDAQRPKRRRKSTISIVVDTQHEVEAAALTGTVIEQFLDITGSVPTGAEDEGLAPLTPSWELRREAERRRNGLR